MLINDQYKIASVLRLYSLAGCCGYKTPEFEIEELFQGGMGICVKLKHLETGDYYALKAIRPELIVDSDAWIRFVEELKIWFTVSSCDGIAEALQIERVNEIPCMCATWMEGGNLRRLMKIIDRRIAYKTLLRIVGSLDWAYSKHGIIHRDLKPENILLDEFWNAYVSDWGLARPVGRYFSESKVASLEQWKFRPELTEVNQFLGTARYAAPEQINGSPDIDHRADIYSLGCIIFEMETGEAPFNGPTISQLLHQHLYSAPPKLGGFLKSTKLGLEKIIARCLEKDPVRRYQSYQELGHDISNIAKGKNISGVSYFVKERYHRSVIGGNEIKKNVRAWEDNEKGYIEINNADSFIEEASALAALERYADAAKLLEPFYLLKRNNLKEASQWELNHKVALNYAYYLSMSSRDQSKAISIYEELSVVAIKPPEYFCNYSLAILYTGSSFDLVEKIATEGIVLYPDDPDILGNLIAAKRFLKKHKEGLILAQKRLSQERSLSSLQDVACLLMDIGDLIRWSDWPNATKNYKASLHLIEEAIALNPNHHLIRLIRVQLLKKLFRFSQATKQIREIKEFSNVEIMEESICLYSEILLEMNDYKTCNSFVEEWINKISNEDHLAHIKCVKMKALANGFMIGCESNGTRVIIPEVVDFFETKTSGNVADSDDVIYMAKIYDWLGRSKDAWEILDKKLFESKYWKVMNTKAMILAHVGLFDQAIDMANEAVTLAPYRPDPLDMLAYAYRLAGNIALADETNALANAIYTQEMNLAAGDH